MSHQEERHFGSRMKEVRRNVNQADDFAEQVNLWLVRKLQTFQPDHGQTFVEKIDTLSLVRVRQPCGHTRANLL